MSDYDDLRAYCERQNQKIEQLEMIAAAARNYIAAEDALDACKGDETHAGTLYVRTRSALIKALRSPIRLVKP